MPVRRGMRMRSTSRIPTSIVVSPSSLSIASGTSQLTAVVQDQTGAVMAGTQPDAWHSADTGVVTVSGTGLVTFVADGGPVNVTASITTVNGTVTSNACAVTASSATSGEPVFTAGVDTLIKQDSFDTYVSSSQMFTDRNNGVFQFSQYNGSGAFDDPGCQLITPGRNGVSGKALRCVFAGVNQESHEWWLQNSPTNDGPSRVKHVWSFWFKFTLTGWVLASNGELPFKFFMAWHSNGTRLQGNTHDYLPGSLPPAGVPGCMFEFLDQIDTGSHQPVPPWATDLINDGLWHRYTMMAQPNSTPATLDLVHSTVVSPSSRDGYARLFIDGSKVLDISAATVGVTPPGGWKPWCTTDDLDSLSDEGFALLKFIGNLTADTPGSWSIDLDDFLWWTQP